MRIRPSAFAIVAVVALAAVGLLRPASNDPPVAAMAWIVAVVLIVLGALWPIWAIRTVRVSSVGPAPDADVGQVVHVPMEVSASVLGLELSWAQGESGWYRGRGSFVGDMPLRPSRRGVRDELELFVRTSGPLGLVTATRAVRASLPRPMYVGPEIGVLDHPVTLSTAESAPRRAAPVGGVELVRSLRSYQPGDPAHLVHWPTTARVGSPMVREMEAPSGESVIVVVDLNDPEGRFTRDQIERAVQRADGVVRVALGSAVEVVLVTAEGDRAVTATCRDLGSLRRRLAPATAGPLRPPRAAGRRIEWITP